MSEVIRRFSLMNRKYLIIIAVILMALMVVTRFILSDVYYMVSSVLIGFCGAGLYYSLARQKAKADAEEK